MSNEIKHLGIIEHIDLPHIRVRIEQSPACISCKVAHSCNISESKKKTIDIYTSNPNFQIGQQVIVSTSSSTAAYSTMIGFVLPLALLLSILLFTKQAGTPDEKAALAAIISLVPYYCLIWILRKRIAKNISFKIEETNHY